MIFFKQAIIKSCIVFFILIDLISFRLSAQKNESPVLVIPSNPKTGLGVSVQKARPLDWLSVMATTGKSIQVSDGAGKVYANGSVGSFDNFLVGGNLGLHTVTVFDANGKKMYTAQFEVTAETRIDDGGYYKNMFDVFYNSMLTNNAETDSVTWNGKKYHFFVPWGLDHYHTMKGLKYFNGNGAQFVDLMREAQREDGMIWSFVQYQPNADYFLTRDKHTGYSKRIGDRIFVRQPTENHPEYIYVNTIYQCWKANGDNAWMKRNLLSASKALDYTLNDPARWSKRFGLLKRVYTIDSWDFQVEDEYLPDLGITNSMIMDPVKSKFGIFFGDNTGYIDACYELSEMYLESGDSAQFKKFRKRAQDISRRLNALSWNGRFFTHFIEEDSTVKRNLGVDEKSQIAQSNAYSLNRNIEPSQAKAILNTYQQLKNNLPPGSPGEWYSIYPPFQKGFVIHNEIWQYMNGGVGGHVAGELSRGAFEHGYEKYGVDIVNRLYELGKKHGDKIYFAYTGSMPGLPGPPAYRPLNIASFANMDTRVKEPVGSKSWMLGKRPGDDLQNLPVGEQTFSNIKFQVIDPEKNDRKAVVAVSKLDGFPATVQIPIEDSAACIYLLHTSTKPVSENIVGALTFNYSDGTEELQYIVMGKHLTYWWFSELKTDYSGIAWYGKNSISEGVGLSWCAIDNPFPTKKISNIILHAPENQSGIYTVLGITLSNKKHAVPVNTVSFGGPDNWAAATAMASLVEGLAGIKDAPQTESFSTPVVSPRWSYTLTDSVEVTIVYEASGSYVAYRHTHDRKNKALMLNSTGTSKTIRYHILLPEQIARVRAVMVDGKEIEFVVTNKGSAFYVDMELKNDKPKKILIKY